MHNGFPGGSKKKVNRAGENIRNKVAKNDDFSILEEWRSAHRAVLNTFQAILRNRTKNTKIVVAQRNKRKATIIDKLSRYPSMKLARMDDVAGCRLIFDDIESLYIFRENFYHARFHHIRKNDLDKYDYIKKPKHTGYRGIHDIYSYDVNSNAGIALKGLLIEIQYWTKIQHAWATAVEVVGYITTSQPKFEQGDTRYHEAMLLASEILSRSFENLYTVDFSIKDDKLLVKKFLEIERELNLLNRLRGLNEADVEVASRKNVILIIEPNGNLEIKAYRSGAEALRNLFKGTSKNPR